MAEIKSNGLEKENKTGNLLALAQEKLERGDLLREQGIEQESITSYKKAIAIKPDYIQPMYRLGKIYHQQKKYSEAAKCYRKIIGLSPNNHSAYIKLARTLKMQGKIYGAIAALAEAMEIKQDLHPGVYRDYGDLLSQINNTNSDAIAAYQKAAAMKSDWGADFYNKLANLLEKKGELSQATTYYLKALNLRDKNHKQYLNVGNIYFKQGLLKEAVGNYQRALELNPNFSRAYKKLGDVLKQMNQLDDAIRCYQRALEIQPDLKVAYRSLGNTLMKQGKRSEAELCYQKAD